MSNKLHRLLVVITFTSGLLCAPSALWGSIVSYSTCPGYPLAACPPGWTSVAIPDNNTNGVTYTFTVPSDPEQIITDVDAWFFITHTYQGDLRVVLTSPAGTNVELVNRAGSPGCGGNGFDADNYSWIDQNNLLRKFLLDDSAANVYNTPFVGCPGTNYVNGSWRPVSSLSAFNGQSKVGPWKLFIQDLAGADVGTLLVWGMNIRTEPNTPPVVDIAMPDDYACGCANGTVTGTATEPDGTLMGYTLHWAVDSAGPWSLITSSSSPVVAGALGTFPVVMPDGYSYVRLIATNSIGMSSTIVKVIHQDRAFGGATIVQPTDGAVLGGNVCMNKVGASDYCFASATLAYAPQGGGFTTFFFTNSPVQEFSPWNTTGLPDGNYTLRVTGTTTCGNSAFDDVAVVIDNTAPTATINTPVNCNSLSGIVQITGTATDAHFGSWTLQYVGGATNGWQTIASGNTQVVNGLLANWNTSALPACGYTLRLLANDASTVSCIGSNGSEYLVSVGKGSGGSCLGDFNHDGQFNGLDTQDYVDALLAGQTCP